MEIELRTRRQHCYKKWGGGGVIDAGSGRKPFAGVKPAGMPGLLGPNWLY